MDTTLLSESLFCRLCCVYNTNGTEIFSENEGEENLSFLVNKYLPVKVEKDGKFPTKICPGCTIQLEATKFFMDLILDGQQKLRHIYGTQQDTLNRQEKQRLKLQEALQNINPSSSVGTYEIQSDETGEKYFIQIITDGPLFPPDHDLSLKASGLDKPKRKRGRPPKSQEQTVKELEVCEEPSEELDNNDEDGKPKRRIKRPTRFREAVQGKELDKILKDVGVVDEEELVSEDEIKEPEKVDQASAEEIIGRIESKDGEDLGEYITVNKNVTKQKLKKYGVNIRRKKFRCSECQKGFRNFTWFKLHKKTHRNNQSSDKDNELNEEETRNINPEINQFSGLNEITEEIIIKPESVEDHLSQLSDIEIRNVVEVKDENVPSPAANEVDKSRFCELCKKSFKTKQNYENHNKAIHNKERPFRCRECNLSFSYANALATHQLKHKRAVYSCETCEKTFNHPSSLIYHRNAEHNNGRRFVCNKCNKSFKHRQLLKRHQLVHSEERPHKCELCPAAFKTRANLNHHQSIHTGQKNFTCAQCGQAFTHKTSLNLHTKWHQGDKPYSCEICQKTFTQKGNLVEHIRIHTGEKPFCCDDCGRSFTTSSQFKIHMKRHTGERPWKCEHCNKTFLYRDAWKSHVRRHLNERPFKCFVCMRAFSDSWSLKKHKKLHTGEKPYVCSICTKAFADNSNLSKHVRTHQAKTLKHVKIVHDDLHKNHSSMYITYQKNVPVEIVEPPLESLDKSDHPPEVDEPDDPATFVDKTSLNEEPLHIQQLVDQDGNPYSLSTQDGEQIKIVASIVNGQEKIQGLLPDGTLVPINLQDTKLDGKNAESEDISNPEIAQLLNSNVAFMSESNQLDNIILADNQLCLVTYNVQDTINPQYLTMS